MRSSTCRALRASPVRTSSSTRSCSSATAKIAVGRPTVKGASVSAQIVEHLRGEKLKIYKFKRRREYRRRRGHRDELTRIRVTSISA